MDEYNGYNRRPWGAGVVVIAVMVFLGVVYVTGRPCPDGTFPWHCPAEPLPSAATETAGTPTMPPNAVVVSFYTSDTKANWVFDVTEDFNAAGNRISSGQAIRVEIVQGDSGDLKEALINGEIRPTVFSPGEMSWVNEANEEWQLLHNRPLIVGDCPATAVAAIGFGMWRPMAEAMGWPEEPIGWTEIMELANDPEGWGRYGHPEWGRFKFGHTHPLESNTGRLAIASVAYWALGRTDGLTPDLVKSQPVVDAIRKLEMRTDHYGGSTRQLFARMAQLGPGYLNAGTTSETNLVVTNQLNEDLPNRQPPWDRFVFIVPAEGAFWSDNPYCILDADWVTADQREAAEAFKDFLLAEEQQRIAMQVHGLRPTNPRVSLGPLIDLQSGTDPTDTPGNVPTYAPIDGPTANALDDVFVSAKRKAIMVVVLDTSASMAGEPIEAAKGATVQFLNLLKEKDRDDEVYVMPFNTRVSQLTPGGRVGDIIEPSGELESKIENLFADGGTALYDAVCQAADLAGQRRDFFAAAGQERLVGLVVLSDGEDTSSDKHTESDVLYSCLPKGEDAKAIPVYAIAYGTAANVNFLTQLANYSHGRFYSADQTNLGDIYDFIAFEQ